MKKWPVGPVLVTGGRGFLGSLVVAELGDQGASDVVPVGRSDGDLVNQDAVKSLFAKVAPRVVIHLAAEVGGIGANMLNPGRFFYANAMMGLNVIEEARRAGVEKFVQVGTVCSYPKHTAVPFSESDLWNGYPEETNAPYGLAKRSLLAMLQAYRSQYEFNGIYLLPANLYGPGDNFDPVSSHVIPALIQRFVEAADANAPAVTLWGTGSASREFLHGRDAARAIVLASRDYDDPAPLNIGTGAEITIRELASMVATAAGYSGSIEWDPSKPDGQPRRSLDTRRARNQLGFEALVALTDGVRETVDWYRQGA